MTDDTTPTTAEPHTPSVRETVLDTLREHADGVAHPLLVAMAVDRADASATLARTTIERLEAEGEIYGVGETWRVTTL